MPKAVGDAKSAGSTLREPTQDELRTLMAGERTLLAWIRTGLAMMGFGFLVERFGLFLRQIAVLQGLAAPRATGTSVWIGTALVFLGVVVCLFGGWRQVAFLRGLPSSTASQLRRSAFQLALPVALAVLGILMAGFLLVTPAR